MPSHGVLYRQAVADCFHSGGYLAGHEVGYLAVAVGEEIFAVVSGDVLEENPGGPLAFARGAEYACQLIGDVAEVVAGCHREARLSLSSALSPYSNSASSQSMSSPHVSGLML